MAARTSQPSRRRAASTTRKPATRTPARSRRPAYSSPLTLLTRGFGALWMGIAHGVGWLVRGVSSQASKAKDLDPEHRRDGLGLLLLGLSVLLAVAIWGGGAGPLGGWLGYALRVLIGAVSVALPLLFAVSALRMMRSDPDPAQRGRAFVGWAAIFLASTGLLEISQDPVDIYQRELAGGILGWFVGMLESAVTAFVAVPLLVLLFGFGVLVITATPVNKIPERLAHLRDLFIGKPLNGEEEEDPEPDKPRR